MKSTVILRSVAIFGIAGVVVAAAVNKAVASAEIARATTELVEQRTIRIMVTPRVQNNDINLSQKNKAIEVAILKEPNWDFADIDPNTVEFAGSIPAVSATKSLDVDNDGLTDRIYTFTTSKLNFKLGDTLGCLSFETIQKVRMSGCDKVNIIEKSPSPRPR